MKKILFAVCFVILSGTSFAYAESKYVVDLTFPFSMTADTPDVKIGHGAVLIELKSQNLKDALVEAKSLLNTKYTGDVPYCSKEEESDTPPFIPECLERKSIHNPLIVGLDLGKIISIEDGRVMSFKHICKLGLNLTNGDFCN